MGFVLKEDCCSGFCVQKNLYTVQEATNTYTVKIMITLAQHSNNNTDSKVSALQRKRRSSPAWDSPVQNMQKSQQDYLEWWNKCIYLVSADVHILHNFFQSFKVSLATVFPLFAKVLVFTFQLLSFALSLPNALESSKLYDTFCEWPK